MRGVKHFRYLKIMVTVTSPHYSTLSVFIFNYVIPKVCKNREFKEPKSFSGTKSRVSGTKSISGTKSRV